MDPLADAGEIDRRTALGLLFDPELDNPENAAVSVEKIGIALGASDIRFNDRASAYRRLWCLAADGLEEISGSGLSDAFVGLLRRAEPQFLDAASDSERLDTFLAAIEGLDRALRSVVPAGVFSDEVCLRVSCNLVRLAKGVLVDPFGPLERALARDDRAPLLMRYDVRCQVGIIACLAAEKTLDSDRPLGFSSLRGILQGHGEEPALPEGLVLSLLKHDGHVSEPSPKLLVSREQPAHAAFCRLNRALVELQRAAAHGIQFGPEIVAEVAASEPNSVVRIANTILGVWSPSSAEAAQTAADDVEVDAAATLVNVTYKIFSEIVAQRPRLMGMIAKVADAMPLPSPPGLEASGILMWCRADGKLILASAGDAASLPIGIEWTDRELNSIPGVKIREAALPAGCRLIVEDERQWMPADIATLYRVGFPIFFEQVRSNEPAVPRPDCLLILRSDERGRDRLLDLEAHLMAGAAVERGRACLRQGGILLGGAQRSRGRCGRVAFRLGCSGRLQPGGRGFRRRRDDGSAGWHEARRGVSSARGDRFARPPAPFRRGSLGSWRGHAGQSDTHADQKSP